MSRAQVEQISIELGCRVAAYQLLELTSEDYEEGELAI